MITLSHRVRPYALFFIFYHSFDLICKGEMPSMTLALAWLAASTFVTFICLRDGRKAILVPSIIVMPVRGSGS